MVDLLRGELGFDGYVVSDCGAIGDFYYDQAHDYVDTEAEAAALAVRMGTDLNCGDGQDSKFDVLPDAVQQGLIDEATIDKSVARLFTARIKLGEFDEPASVPFTQIPFDVVASREHLALSEEAARASLVLLKNDGVLPLAQGTKVAVVGPNADNWMTLVANYYGIPTAPVTALAGVKAKAGEGNTSYAVGSTIAGDVYTNYQTIGSEYLFHENSAGEIEPGLTASYYSEPSRTGDVVRSEVDPAIDFYWKRSPADESLLNDYFSVHWSGYLVPKTSSTYRLSTTRWTTATLDGAPVENQEFELEAGKRYRLDVTTSMERMWYRNTIETEARLSWVDTGTDFEEEALSAVGDADVILFFGGIDANLEGEEMDVKIDGFLGGDRTHLNLPAVQQSLLEKLHATGKPVVLVNFSGSAMALNWADENLAAIVQAFYPGEKAGNAIADLLWGEFSPSGRLPVTFYSSLDGMPEFDDYAMTNRTYKYYQGDPLYGFGHGLSYTSFAYSELMLPDSVATDAPLKVGATVTNTGDRQGREVVQVYATRAGNESPSVPRIELVGFSVVELAPGASQTVSFEIDPAQLQSVDANGNFVAPDDESIVISIGGGQPQFVGEDGAISGQITY
jgi:beta-glucosidase